MRCRRGNIPLHREARLSLIDGEMTVVGGCWPCCISVDVAPVNGEWKLSESGGGGKGGGFGQS